jgi:hypothetical protein
MKISNYIGTFALVAMLTACSTEEEQVHFAGNEVKVDAAIGRESTFTRSNPAGDEEKQSNFNDYDQIGISMNDGAARLYEMKNGIWDVKDGEPLKWETEITEFMAFYPYSYGDKLYNSFEKGHIIENQISKEGMALSDYMIADRSEASIPANRELDLYFLRKTARVIVDIQNSTFTNEFDSPLVSGVTIFSQLEIPATQGADVTEIKPYKMDDSNPKSSWMALVAPNAEDASKNFICIKVQETNTADDPKPYYVKGIPNLEEGNSYTYKLKIGKDRVTIENVTVAEWTDGTAISGGAASSITVEGIKESVTTQLKMGNDVVLTLTSNASSDIFNAIKAAIKEKGVADGSVNLTLKNVMTIPDGTFKDVTWLNKVTLPDAVTIDKNAFGGSSLKDIEASKVSTVKMFAFDQCKSLKNVNLPKVSEIGIKAFNFCSSLRNVLFGTLTKVWTGDEKNTDGIFESVYTKGISLTLSSSQSLMDIFDDAGPNFFWLSINQPYKGSAQYDLSKFIGYEFNEIKFFE